MKTLYIECNMGAAGDMLMSALYELLEDKESFLNTMNSLGLPGVHLEAASAVTSGISGTHMTVTVHGEEEDEHLHHHEHDHDHDHEHEHHHDHYCVGGHEGHPHHHHGHDADEGFYSWGVETTRTFSQEGLETILAELDTGRYGAALRAKGIVKAADGRWLHFDYVPEDHQIRFGGADYTGRLCVIGSKLDEAGLKALFGV